MFQPPIKCLNPIRIRNKYTGDYMFVPCRKCEVCQINAVNNKAYQLSKEFVKYPFNLFVTLTYDNKHLPYVPCGSNVILRGDFVPHILGYLDKNCDVHYQPSNFPVNDVTSVLYKKDVQDFIKRLRINYERKTKRRFPWSYHYLGEYGSTRKRSHYHIAFFGKQIFPEDFRCQIIDAWPLCDWSRLDVDEAFQYASAGVSNYLSSYLNCFVDCGEFFRQRPIKSFVARSKNIHYAVVPKVRENFEKAVKSGLSTALLAGDSNPFEFCDVSKKNTSSVRLLPKKYLSSLFTLPASVRKTSFSNQCRKCVCALQLPKEELINSNYQFYLSYVKYCNMRNVARTLATLITFIDDSNSFYNAWQSALIKHSMMEYDPNFPVRYYASRVQSYVDKLDIRSFRLRMRGVNADYDYIQGDYSSYFKDYVKEYGRKLLPKHLNDLLNI